MFKKCDSNNDGLLNEIEFSLLLNHLSAHTENIEENKDRYLSILDPYNHGMVNFTDTVTLFGNVSDCFILI